MQKYNVVVTRDTTESATLTVVADSPEAAEHAALAASWGPEVDWQQDDTTNLSRNHYATNVEACNDR